MLYAKKPPAQALCDERDCGAEGFLRAPLAKCAGGEIIYGTFCKVHARMRNESWNFFSDMTEEEVEDFRHQSYSWHRPLHQKSHHSPPSGDHPAGFLYEGTVLQGLFGSDTSERRGIDIPDEIKQALRVMQLDGLPGEEELKEQFRRLVKKHHPDRHGKSAAKRHHSERLKTINASYKSLCQYLARHKREEFYS